MPSPQCWLCLSVVVPHETAEAVANFLTEMGSAGVVEGVHDPSQPLPPVTEVQGFFPGDARGAALREALVRYLQDLRHLFPQFDPPQPRLAEVSGESWAEGWREHFPPVPVGERFLILPPWEPVPAQARRIAIVINPGMAFGTGHHATTHGCLEAIEWCAAVHGPPARALDVGTGSGILAVALAKLGTPEVWATDIDPVALEEARKNIAANHVTASIHLSGRAVEQLLPFFPLTVANLFSSTLVQRASAFAGAVAPGGHAILSGIQQEQEGDVLSAYRPPAWRLARRYPREGWVTLVLRRS